MKKSKLFIFLLALLLTIITLVIGLVFAGTTTESPDNNPSEPTKPTTSIPNLNIPNGTYYYVLGTSSAYSGNASSLKRLARRFPQITIDENQYVLQCHNVLEGSAYSQGENIIFENQSDVQNLLQIDTQHPEGWYDIYFPKQTRDWVCTYDATTQIITIVHNSDFMQLKYFDNIEQYTQYLDETFVQDGYFDIYPKPNLQ